VLPERIRHDTLSTRENDYFGSYSGLLWEYCDAVGLDLTSDVEVCSFKMLKAKVVCIPITLPLICVFRLTICKQPPKELLIQVRVVQSCGEIMTDNGPVDLTEVGSTYFLRRFGLSLIQTLITHTRKQLTRPELLAHVLFIQV
jgi:hypothetical protein